jgi:hypothetical protein
MATYRAEVLNCRAMAKISIPTIRKVKPPLLIEAAHLEALDQIIERNLVGMREYNNKEIADEAAKRVRTYVHRRLISEQNAAAEEEKYKKEFSASFEFREERSVSIYLTKGKEIKALTFSEAISQPVGDDELATGFLAYLKVGRMRAKVTLGPESWRPHLEVEVQPNDIELTQQLFGTLSNWASAFEAPKWQQRWVNMKWLPSSILFLWLMMGVLFVPLAQWSQAGAQANKEEGRQLLSSGGVNASNEQRAISIILAIESEYSSTNVHAKPLGLKYWAYVIFGGLILGAVSIFPNTCIGLWKGRRRVAAWRWWIRLLTVGIPLSLLGYVLVPWVMYWFKISPPSP